MIELAPLCMMTVDLVPALAIGTGPASPAAAGGSIMNSAK